MSFRNLRTAKSERRKQMFRRSIILIVFLVFICCSFGYGQNEPGMGWIEGFLTNKKGVPVHAAYEEEIVLVSKSGKRIEAHSDTQLGGLYSIRNLKPGIYEMFVNESEAKIRGEWTNFRPQRIFGVVIKPDVRTILNIEVEEGTGLQQIGEPDIATENVVLISDELKRVKKDIEVIKEKLNIQYHFVILYLLEFSDFIC